MTTNVYIITDNEQKFVFPYDLICYSQFIRTMSSINIDKPFVDEQKGGGASKDKENDDSNDDSSGSDTEEDVNDKTREIDIKVKSATYHTCDLVVKFLKMNKGKYIDIYNGW